MSKICVICATVRDPSKMLQSYAKNAADHGFDLSRLHFVLITEDFCDKRAMNRTLDDSGLVGEVYDNRGRIRWMHENGIRRFSKLIPRRSHAETSFGLLWLLSNKDYDYGTFIDDDTFPTTDDFFGGHVENIEVTKRVMALESSTKWVNVLYSSVQTRQLYPRGYPYSKMKGTIQKSQSVPQKIVLSQGLWTDVPDLDSFRLLVNGNMDGLSSVRLGSEHYDSNFVVASGNYLTVCSMNLAFRAEISPYFYQLPMDDNPYHIGRFDDIWSGVILKRICDKAGFQMINGRPLCAHEKSPRNIFSDLKAEGNGLEMNEHFSEILDSIDLTSGDPEDMYREIALYLKKGDWSGLQNGAFLNFMGKSMISWGKCCERLVK